MPMELKQQETGRPAPPATPFPPVKLVFPGCGILLTSPFRRAPLLINPNNDQLASAFRSFHSSVASNADRVLKFLHQFASQNPLIRQLSNLSSQFDSFGQIQCRNNLRMNNLSRHNFAAVLPGDSVAGVVVANGVLNFLNIYNILLTVRLVLTWFPSPPPAIVSPLSMICDPYLNMFRGIIPPLGGTLDLSPILAFIALNAFTNVAAAFLAELPSAGLLEEDPSKVRTEGQAVSQKWRKSSPGNKLKSLTPESGHSD